MRCSERTAPASPLSSRFLSGLIQPNSGSLELFGEFVRLDGPRAAQRLGLQAAFQEMTQIRDLTVAQNLLLPDEPINRWGGVRRREAERRVVEHLERLGLGYIDPRSEIRDLDLPVRQKLEIARAIYRTPRVLVLDEPTSTLSGRDIDWLGEIIADAKARGASVIFISHRMPEVNAFCESLTVLRNGKDVGTARVGELSEDEIVRMIIGRSLTATFPTRGDTIRKSSAPALAARNLSVVGRLHNASFEIAPGEIFSASPVSREWASSNCFWEVSAPCL